MKEHPQKRGSTASESRSYSFVHLEFGSLHRKTSLALLALLARRVPALHRRLIIVDNAGVPSPLATAAPFDEIVLLAGDNTRREFSGWDIAAAWLKNEAMPPSDGYVFSNDTVARHREFGIGRKLRFAAAFTRLPDHSTAVVCGEIDGLAEPVAMPWGRHAFYASTYLFGLNRAAFDLLTPFCALGGEIDALLAPDWPATSLFSAAMPRQYAEFLTRWLHEPGGWYGARPLAAEHFIPMKEKARSILLEQSIGARLGSAGGKLVSIYQGDGGLDRALGMLAERYERRWRLSERLRRPQHARLREPRLR